jgi:hypothetical protein
MQSRLDRAGVASKLLKNALVALRHDLVGVVDEAAAEAGRPCSQTTTALTPAMQTLAVGRDFGELVVHLRQDDVLGSSVELFMLLIELPVGAETHVGHDSKLL